MSGRKETKAMSKRKKLRRSSYAVVALTPALLGEPHTVQARTANPQTTDRPAELSPMGAAPQRLLEAMLALSPAEKLKIGGDRIRLSLCGDIGTSGQYSCQFCPTNECVTPTQGCVTFAGGPCNPGSAKKSRGPVPHAAKKSVLAPGAAKKTISRVQPHSGLQTNMQRPKGQSTFASTPDKLHKTITPPPPPKIRPPH